VSVALKRGARFFTIMGFLIIGITFWTGLIIPWEALRKIDPDLEFFFILNFITSLSIGLTEIAVAWLLGKHLE
jgi:hypothetical protein